MLTAPALLHASGAVLTDGPALTLLLLSTYLSIRGAKGLSTQARNHNFIWFFAAGTTLALAFGLRESSLFHLLSLLGVPLCLAGANNIPLGKCLRATLWALLGCVLGCALILRWAYVQPGWLSTVQHWQHAMQAERAGHPYTLRDTLMYGAWLLALGPFALLAALSQYRVWITTLVAAIRARTLKISSVHRPLAVLVLVSAAELLLLAMYQDIAFSPRYLLPALPCAIALPAALAVNRQSLVDAKSKQLMTYVSALMLLTVLIVGPVLRWQQRSLRTAIDQVSSRLASAPSDSVIVTGQLCPAIQLSTRLHRVDAMRTHRPLPQWKTICPGWDWPDNLQLVLDTHRAAGRHVIVDLRSEVWVGSRQQSALQQARAYIERPTRSLVSVWR
jgi:hypothetical protein